MDDILENNTLDVSCPQQMDCQSMSEVMDPVTDSIQEEPVSAEGQHEQTDEPSPSHTLDGAMISELRAMEQKLADKDQHCLMLEQQLIQANRQVETCYYQMEANEDQLQQYASELSSLQAELERRDVALEKARHDAERLEVLQSERQQLSEMVAGLTRELDIKIRDANLSTASVENLKQLLSEVESEKSRLEEQMQAVESERQAHKLKASEMYELYQQLRDENVTLVAELKERGLTNTAPTDHHETSTKLRELAEELERTTKRCKEKDVQLSECDVTIQELQNRLNVCEAELRRKVEVQTTSDTTDVTQEVRLLEDELRIVKISNSGLVSEIAALKAQLTDKNARIDHLNCELMMIRQNPSPRRELDLEAYMHHRSSGLSSSEADRRRNGHRGVKEAVHQVFTTPRYRMFLVLYTALLHLLLLLTLLK
ncbi:uncharacterized protein BXIN_1127 [Babesia sp. Xinjiang]|uniref:uncharacterized protein n=1 Tax=Babesia sp. Xinjiang TaxID=462227 RepID=UPI000A23B4E8|nr:uncharacterized protein BXIN_1127 [Babesia sp. Xinjiang]ORM42342.1 hypothetical protein BXIN_1127 [Babesia sp. Xinjiang]